MAEREESFKPSAAINKAVSMLKNKYSTEMIDRHTRAVNRVATTNKNGLLLKDLTALCELLYMLTQRLQSNPQYMTSLCQLIELCGKPFLKQKISDENNYTPNVIQTLNLLGQLTVAGQDPITAAVTSAIASFYRQENINQAFLEGLQMTKITYNAALIERSGVAKYLVEALDVVGNYGTMLQLLDTIKLLSVTPTNCNHMLSQDLANIVCRVICPPDTDHDLLFMVLEILWNLLDHGSHLQVGEQLSTLECMRTLKQVFHELMVGSYSKQLRELRNDLLMICLRIAQLCPDAPFVETGFFSDLCTFGTFTEETGSKPHLQSLADSLKQLKLTKEHEDYELKKTLMCILTTLSANPTAIKIMTNKRVLRSFLSYVVPSDHPSGNWNFAQFEELQLMALSCLSALGPLCVEDYMTCQGNSRVLILVDWCTKHELEFKGHGNSFHGKGGRGSKISQLRQSLHLLLSMCSSADDGVIQDLHDQGAIPIMLSLLKHFIALAPTEVDDPVLIEMQADVLLILSCICDLDMHRKELFGGYDGVNLLVSYLKRDIGKFGSGLGHNRLLLAAVDCVWCAVVGSPITEDIFLETGGAFVLLDLLKVCPSNMQGLALGVLVDLCENLKAIPHVSSWRGSDHTSTWSLLAQLWRAEERDMDVPRGYKDTLAGSLQPLIGAQQNASGVPPIPTHFPSAAITDVSENMRAKIYALCYKMGFQYPHEELSVEDRITICIMESYLDFKSGEVWNEVAEELAQEGLRPVTPDQECLTEILHTHEGKAEETLKTQHELIDEQVEVEEAEENRLYEKIKEYHQTRENRELHMDDFVERTCDYEALRNARRKQLDSVNASRRSSIGIGNRFHSLQQHRLNITTFCGRHVTVSTTPRRLLTLPVVSDPSPC